VTETEARRVLLLRAIESEPPGPLWNAADRTWASQAAQDAPAERFVAERARHAFERLAPREPALARWIAARHWRTAWVAGAALLGAVAGVLIDAVGPGQRIELLALPLLGVLAWNLAVYAGLAVAPLLGGRWPRRLRGALQLWMITNSAAMPATRAASLAWSEAGAPLHAARAALLLHVAAAALGLGLVAGLYARGLVLDYRAGWQSTFLDAAQVHAFLAAVLTPASALTGIGVPGTEAIAAMRIVPAEAAQAPAAAWIHLLAATLAIVVVVPRLLLALASGLRARGLAANLPMPLREPYFDRLMRARRGEPAVVAVLPHAAEPSAAALEALRSAAAIVFGGAPAWQVLPTLAFGAESEAPRPAAALRIALFDAAATPEAEQQGRLLEAIGSNRVPCLAVVDEARFAKRFAGTPQRIDERRAAWRRLGIATGVRIVCADLEAADAQALASEFEAALVHP
jgi:hypothetical protein